MAITGLVADDTVGHVVHELAKWLYWVELHNLPVTERINRIEELLQRFVLVKHNDFVTRLNNGNEGGVSAQVRSAIKSASRIDRPESLELFARLREKRSQGKYERPIQIAPILDGCTQGEGSSPMFFPLTTYMFINKEPVEPLETGDGQETVDGLTTDLPARGSSQDAGETASVVFPLTTYMFINKDAPLPGVLESEVEQIARDHRMRKRNGGYPLVRFARRLLNTLWERGGEARLSSEVLIKMVGTTNPNQQVWYRRLLQDRGLIQEGDGDSDHLWLTWELLNGDFDHLWQSWEPLNGGLAETPGNNAPHRPGSSYQPGAFSKMYRLTQRVREVFEDHYGQAP
jgi:hypothetical protein